MNGKIYFETLEELADFLIHFTGCTATFQVDKRNRQWVLEFLGGH